MSPILGEGIMKKQLGWRMFLGSTEKFRELRSHILNSDGNVKEEYKGMKGYVQFALVYGDKNMKLYS